MGNFLLGKEWKYYKALWSVFIFVSGFLSKMLYYYIKGD